MQQFNGSIRGEFANTSQDLRCLLINIFRDFEACLEAGGWDFENLLWNDGSWTEGKSGLWILVFLRDNALVTALVLKDAINCRVSISSALILLQFAIIF
jgi:hypothetical protein